MPVKLSLLSPPEQPEKHPLSDVLAAAISPGPKRSAGFPSLNKGPGATSWWGQYRLSSMEAHLSPFPISDNGPIRRGTVPPASQVPCLAHLACHALPFDILWFTGAVPRLANVTVGRLMARPGNPNRAKPLPRHQQ
jgi:hypothetical protein